MVLERKITSECTSYCDTIWYVVKGELGAVHYMFMRLKRHGTNKVYPLDLGVHACKPLFPEHTCMENCDILDSPCFYSGSSKLANDMYMRFKVTQDPERLWLDLENYYGQTLYL